MSERKSANKDPRVSPYLLRRARTYEEYLRDRAIADRLMKRLDEAASAQPDPFNAASEFEKQQRASYSAEATLSVAGQGNRRDTTDNQA